MARCAAGKSAWPPRPGPASTAAETAEPSAQAWLEPATCMVQPVTSA